MEVLFQSGNASTAGEIGDLFSEWKAPASPPPQAIGNLRAFFYANSLFLSKSVSGAAVNAMVLNKLPQVAGHPEEGP